ncbi:MAG: tripartite tricarboxylate transporter substrate binding protein [Pseudomonadota bacterium]
MKPLRNGIVSLAILGLAIATTPANADFPDKPITIIYPWAPGDAVETVLRTLGEAVADDLGQPIVINNVQGAGGKKSMAEGAKATPDGYTMVNNWVAPQIAGKLFDDSLPYENSSFIPIAGVMAIPFTVTLAADHPSNNVAEFLEWAKSEGRTLNFGVCSAQSVPRLVGEQFMRAAGVDVNPIPNNTGCMGDNMTGLLNGSLDVSVGIVPATKIMEGQVKHISLISDEPHALAPDLATAMDQGVKVGWGNAALGWGGLAVPAGTPDDVVATLQESVGKVVQSDSFADSLGDLRHMIKYVAPGDFAVLWEDSMEVLQPHVAELKANN